MTRTCHFSAERLRLAFRALRHLRDADRLSTAALLEIEDAGGVIRRQRQEADAALLALVDFLGRTKSREGITAEPQHAYDARVERGVTTRRDGSALVIRVPGYYTED